MTVAERIRLPRPIEPVRLPPRPELCEWGRQHGIDIASHGRVPLHVERRYVDYRLRTRRRLIRMSQERHPSTFA